MTRPLDKRCTSGNHTIPKYDPTCYAFWFCSLISDLLDTLSGYSQHLLDPTKSDHSRHSYTCTYEGVGDGVQLDELVQPLADVTLGVRAHERERDVRTAQVHQVLRRVHLQHTTRGLVMCLFVSLCVSAYLFVCLICCFNAVFSALFTGTGVVQNFGHFWRISIDFSSFLQHIALKFSSYYVKPFIYKIYKYVLWFVSGSNTIAFHKAPLHTHINHRNGCLNLGHYFIQK